MSLRPSRSSYSRDAACDSTSRSIAARASQLLCCAISLSEIDAHAEQGRGLPVLNVAKLGQVGRKIGPAPTLRLFDFLGSCLEMARSRIVMNCITIICLPYIACLQYDSRETRRL